MAKRGEYIASKDNTSVGRPGINENVNNVKTGDLAGNNIMPLIMSFMPVIGDVQDAVDLKESIEDKDAVGMVLGAASLLPFVGSAATYANKARKLEKMKESVVSYYKDIAIPIYREVSNNKISKLDDGAKKAFQIMDKKKMDPERISDYLDYFEGIKPDELNAAKHAYEYMKYIDDFSDVADDRFNEISTSLVSREDLEKMGHGTARGLYDPETSTIYIRDDLDDDGIYYNLVHEIGHGIDKNDHLNKIESGIVIDDDGLNLIKRAYDVPSNISPKTDYEKRLYKSSESINEKIQTNRELRAKLYNMLKEEIGVEHPTLGELRTLIDEGGLSPKVTSNILSSLSGYGEVYAKNIISGKQYEQNDLIKEALKGVPSVLLPYVLLNAYKEDNEKPDFKEGGWYPSDTLIDFLISKEGFEPRVRVPSKPNKKTGKKDKETTGYGVTDEDIVKRNKGKTITKSQAKKDFREAVRRRIGQFMEATPNFDKLNNNERDALFSYFYNIGYGGYTDQSPEFQKALSNLDKEKIALNIDFDYNNEDRKGAMKRRNAERRLFRLPVGEDFEFHIESDNYPEESNVIDNASIEPESDSILSAILSTKNDLELQDPISTTRGEAFKEARKRGLKEFTWNGKRYNTNIKKEGGVVGKQREAYEYFTGKRGMSKIQALAIIGNLMAESGLKDDIYGDNRTSYGIQQWHNERMDKLFKHAKKKGHSTPTFKDQLEFLADEYEGKTGYSNFLYTRKGKEGPGYYNYSRQDFMNADNLKDAVVAWNQGAGRPHKSVIRNDDRYNYAMEVAKNLGLDIEENSVSSYGQMGFGDDGEIAASVTLPEVEVAAALPNPEAPSPERQSEEERFRTWTETYGKDIVNHLLTLDGKKDGDDSDYSMMYKQHEKESEEDKKMALINAVLPNIQLRIKGVTDN